MAPAFTDNAESASGAVGNVRNLGAPFPCRYPDDPKVPPARQRVGRRAVKRIVVRCGARQENSPVGCGKCASGLPCFARRRRGETFEGGLRVFSVLEKPLTTPCNCVLLIEDVVAGDLIVGVYLARGHIFTVEVPGR
ncbi:hypothetical protein BESB_061550 [Besnoitia besnoiti]|uniref:Uncharacterized protein n=1 Tax=Besnoitia besnoiti TaxID=94643 RepID=A0A2A9M9W5_BESBE|nr:hypothetical protein BESB_061550 [Besnoitia besnoiti]PFH35268.1 hypothetical protein BESB_061550 [Besnoitia besnoiti]